MAQSDIQSFLEQNLGTQSAIQSNLPVTPNNGNPNTIYNLSPPNVRQFNPATGNLPPMSDAFGNWAVPARPQAPPVDLATLLGQYTTQMRTVAPRPTTLVIPPAFITPPTGVPTSPPPAQPTAPPMSDPLPPQQVVGGGGGPNASTPLPPSAGVAGTGSGGWNNDGGRDIQDIAIRNGVNTIGGTTAPMGGAGGSFNLQNFLDSNPGLASRLGVNNNNTMDWQQIVDLLSEPFVTGDLWNSQTNTWNLGNIAGGILGGPVELLNQAFNNQLNPDAERNQLLAEVASAIRGDRLTTRQAAGSYLNNNVGLDMTNLTSSTSYNPNTGQVTLNAGVPSMSNWNNRMDNAMNAIQQQIDQEAQYYSNMGDIAQGFGIGIGAANSPSAYAISDAIKANALNRV